MSNFPTVVTALLSCAALAALGCSDPPKAAQDSDGTGGAGADTGSFDVSSTGGDGTGGAEILDVRPEGDGGEAGAVDPCDGENPPPECNPPECGDGEITGEFEVCDDGRKCVGGTAAGLPCSLPEECDSGVCEPVGGDGCSAACDAVETDWECPTPGAPCVYTVKCSDGKIGGAEQCDDGGACVGGTSPGAFCIHDADCGAGGLCQPVAGDGCDGFCQLELGYACPLPGTRCVAAACGDGFAVGGEQCEPGTTNPPEACAADCTVADGYVCTSDATTGTLLCVVPSCNNNGIVDLGEACDDGNNNMGDGCTPLCVLEPDCSAGACTSACGDGIKFSTEGCDDGNTAAGDGCSATCEIELGYQCDLITSSEPESISIPIVIRDFADTHPDMEFGQGMGAGEPIAQEDGEDGSLRIVRETLGTPADGVLDNKPVYFDPACEPATVPEEGNWDAKCTVTTWGAAEFAQWFVDSDVSTTVVKELVMVRTGTSQYEFDSRTHLIDGTEPATEPDGFFPIDELGLTGASCDSDEINHNFHFTSEVRYWFEYSASEPPTLTFSGDDDVWVYVNGQLALDIGGIHSREEKSFTIDAANATAWGLVDGNIYEIAVFQAERNQCQSNYWLTLAGFLVTSSTCAPICGDGIVAGAELCDDGELNGTYGHCSINCDGLGPHCGDAVVQAEEGEECDNGTNLSGYQREPGDCAPGCVLPPYCGDGLVDSAWGELCDDGVNDGGYRECQPGCQPGPRCGDGIVHPEGGEECDDGNTQDGDGCSSICMIEQVE
jgi:fibro-slime domain-containing protein